MNKEIKNINKYIKKYTHQVTKAEKLNTTDNAHYRERKAVLRYLLMLKMLMLDMDADMLGDLIAAVEKRKTH